MTDFPDINLLVDLDQERNIIPKEGRTPNQHRVVIRKTSAVNLASVQAYLDGTISFDNTVLEGISEMNTHATMTHY